MRWSWQASGRCTSPTLQHALRRQWGGSFRNQCARHPASNSRRPDACRRFDQPRTLPAPLRAGWPLQWHCVVEDEQTLFVSRTGNYRVWKIAVNADSLDLSRGAGSGATVLFDNLPGYPDNLMRGLDGGIWLRFTKPHQSEDRQAMADKAVPAQVDAAVTAGVVARAEGLRSRDCITEDGKVVADLQDPTGAYPETTAITRNGRSLVCTEFARQGAGLAATALTHLHHHAGGARKTIITADATW